MKIKNLFLCTAVNYPYKFIAPNNMKTAWKLLTEMPAPHWSSDDRKWKSNKGGSSYTKKDCTGKIKCRSDWLFCNTVVHVSMILIYGLICLIIKHCYQFIIIDQTWVIQNALSCWTKTTLKNTLADARVAGARRKPLILQGSHFPPQINIHLVYIVFDYF